MVDGEWFYSTRENIEDNIGLSEHKQRMSFNKLIDLSLIEIRKQGIPCKNYYKLNEQEILECYSNTQKKFLKVPKNSVVENFDNKTLKNETSGSRKNEQRDIENFDINKNNNKNNNKKNNNIHTQDENFEEEKKQFGL